MKSGKKFKYSKKIISNSAIYKISTAVNFIFAAFCFFLLLLYFIGNYQDFQDSSQNFILKTLFYASVFNAIFSFLLFVESVLKIFSETKKARFIANSVFFIFGIIFAVFCVEFSNIIIFFSAGLKL